MMPSKSRSRSIAALILLLISGVLLWRLAQFLGLGWQSIFWPYELDYGEGIVWQQAKLMFTPDAYGPINGFPAIVFHYTPLYHVTTRLVSSLLGTDMLTTGRAISIGSTLLTSVMIGVIVSRATPTDTPPVARATCGVVGGLAIFCFVPVIFWAQLMKVDMLAFLLSVSGFWVGLKAFDRPRLIHAATLLFVAAIYTKQTSLAAPAALFLLMLWLRPRLAFAGIASCAVMGLATLAGLEWATGGGFARHIFLYNINRFDWSQLILIIDSILVPGPFFVGVAVVTSLRRMADVRRRLGGRSFRAIVSNPADLAWLAIIVYFVTSSLMLFTLAKQGSNVNYLIEWIFVIAMLVGLALTETARLVAGQEGDVSPDTLTVIGVPLAIAAQAWLMHPPDLGIMRDSRRNAEMASLSARIGATDKPVIADDMSLLMRSGKRVVWEPAIFAELAGTGAWDERPFVERIRRHEFAMFVTIGKQGDYLFNGRYDKAVSAAMATAYPVLDHQAGYTLHLPASSEQAKP
jgi:hypothetical protein